MTPDEPDSDRTQIQPPGFAEGTAGFDKTRAYAPPPPVAAPPPAADMGNGLPIGTRLAEFELTQLLGEGGFGIVYLANDHSLQRRVALKEYMPSSLAARSGEYQVQVKSERYRETFEAGRKSFINEARLLAQFDHPSLVKVYRFWEANGTAYMVMPFYEGKNLRDTLRGAPNKPEEQWLRTLLAPLTEALMVIHGEQCYHRDIAPDNVMMLAGSNRPLLLDFGAARRVIGDMTQALTVILKPGYAPVEQYAEIPGMKQGPWTDVYALAAVVHYAITGRTPPPSVGRLLNDTYQPLVESAAGRYSEGFLAAIDRGLAVRPEGRTQSIEQLRHELELDRLVPATTMLTISQPAAWPTAGAPAVTVRAVPPTAIMPPPAPRAAPAPSPVVSPENPSPPAPKSKSLAVGVGVGALVLAGLGVVAWRMLAAPAPAPVVAVTPAAALTPLPGAAPPPVTAQPVAPAAPPSFEPEREFDRILRAETAGFGVVAVPVKTELRIGAKDEFKFRVTAGRDGFVYVVGQSSDGSLALLVPNGNSPSVQVRKGQTWSFPSNDGFYIPAADPPGTSRVMVMVSANKRSFDAMQPKPEGPIQLFATGEKAAALAAQYTGPGSVLAGRHQCPTGATCADEYGVAIMKFETLP